MHALNEGQDFTRIFQLEQRPGHLRACWQLHHPPRDSHNPTPCTVAAWCSKLCSLLGSKLVLAACTGWSRLGSMRHHTTSPFICSIQQAWKCQAASQDTVGGCAVHTADHLVHHSTCRQTNMAGQQQPLVCSPLSLRCRHEQAWCHNVMHVEVLVRGLLMPPRPGHIDAVLAACL